MKNLIGAVLFFASIIIVFANMTKFMCLHTAIPTLHTVKQRSRRIFDEGRDGCGVGVVGVR